MRKLLLLCCLLVTLVTAKQGLTQTERGSALSDQEVSLLKSVGPWPVSTPRDPGNELSGLQWAEQLGEKLFSDTDLSGNRRMACITCHLPDKGFADGLKVAVGASTHVRNTQGLFNAGLQRWFGWDGGADSLWAASLRPMLSDIEMDADISAVASLFRDKEYVSAAFAQHTDVATLTDEAFVVLLAKAIAAFTRDQVFSLET